MKAKKKIEVLKNFLVKTGNESVLKFMKANPYSVHKFKAKGDRYKIYFSPSDKTVIMRNIDAGLTVEYVGDF
ncbi:MAG: hypothetical protein PWQ77_1678 [Kosmotogales bacterium]|nr:hypothetical protein [Kosmotogales bacterium]